MKKVVIASIVLLGMFINGIHVLAAVPDTITYQGKLSDSSGSPVNGTVDISFGIYSTSSGGTALWNETQSLVNVADGIFTVTLGSVTPIPNSVFSDPDLYLGIKVDTDDEMTPRQKLHSAPFAIKAGVADSVNTPTIGSLTCVSGEIPKWNGTSWNCSADSGITSESDPTVNALSKATLSCTTDQIAKWNGAQWVCATEMGGAGGVQSGFMIMGESSTPPAGYTYTGETIGNDGYWVYKNPITERCFAAAATVNSKVYLIGGSGVGSESKVEEFNPVTNTWLQKTPMPTGRQSLAAAVVDSKIYVMGGYGAARLSVVEEYDPATDTWITKASMATVKEGLAAAVVNNKLYAIGGRDNGGIMTTVEEYNPATDTWTTKAPMPTEKAWLATAVVDGLIYAIGGKNNSVSSEATVYQYDPATDIWIAKAPMNNARSYFAAVAVNNKIYAIGGGASVVQDTVEIYDPLENIWSDSSPLLEQLFPVSATSVNNKIYATGCNNDDGNVEELNTKTYFIHRKD